MSGRRSLAAGLLELLRPPNVFTAVADSAAGLALVNLGVFTLRDAGLWCLPASACLYLGGMALNDYFDREVDARERPDRPIPAGVVPAGAALGLGGGLLGAGVAFAGLAGAGALLVAIALAGAILAYDARLKGTVVGFVNMGLCRGLNFSMPLALSGGIFPPVFLLAPLCLTAYVAVVTFLSRDEVVGNAPLRARIGVGAMALVAASLGLSLAALGGGALGWVLYALVLARLGQLHLPLLTDASGPRTGQAIGGSILLIPVFDAALVAAAGFEVWAVAVAAFSLPALALRRLYSPT